MKYMLMIFEDETVYGTEQNSQAMQDIIGQHMAFGQKRGDRIVGGGALLPTATATTVRTEAGSKTLHDGPFAETKEQLGGFYLIDVPDLDAAIAIAREVPISKNGSVEVRPLLTMDADA
ncbi:MAG TPA: YciI family protein [Allosphingosinicella sp.]|jgi:hypothetical protein|uniref:YciI family protein n=1 Tax=Allosphingosinicella sp. TaxID=2823234 RepID=UPI002F296519